MTNPLVGIRQWSPVAASVAAVVLASWFAVSRKSDAAQGIRRMHALGVRLSTAAQQVQEGTRSQEDLDHLTEQKLDLQKRMTDCTEPSLVQAELMSSAKQAGLSLRQIQPVRQQPAASRELCAAEYPRYRLMVSGGYEQVAQFLELGTKQRLPVRVVEFSIRSITEKTEAQAGRLAADITVEAFQHPKEHNDAPQAAPRGQDGK